MNELFLEPKLEFNAGNIKKYEVEAIKDSAIYSKEAEGHLLGLYYLISWKSYSKKENTRESSFAIMHLQKMISTFHKNHSKKLTATFLFLNFTPSMAKLLVKLIKSPSKLK